MRLFSWFFLVVQGRGLPGIEDLRDAFDLFDSDHNGSLDLSELLHAFEQCAPSTVPSSWAQHELGGRTEAIELSRSSISSMRMEMALLTWMR